jgi:CHAT domain-containing protein
VIVGNPTMPTVALAGGPTVLEPLAGAEAEARTVARGLTVQPLLAAAATETALRARLPGASLIHLATHGFAFSDGAMARRSFVALARDSLHDGLLTVGDLLDDPALRLSADLVVLSACQTGLGNLRQAEGTIGFQRAFLARGARSVLVSLWSVSDLATTRLMERFYAHWRSDPDRPGKAEALRRAQEDVRRLPGFSHPRYWAAFQVVGAR